MARSSSRRSGARTTAGRELERRLRQKAAADEPKATTARNKFNAQKTLYKGHVYDSKYEASVAQELDALVKAGVVARVERQVAYRLNDSAKAPILTVDFRVWRLDGSYYLVEAKGKWTEAARLRVRLFRDRYPDIVLIVKRKPQRRKRVRALREPAKMVRRRKSA